MARTSGIRVASSISVRAILFHRNGINVCCAHGAGAGSSLCFFNIARTHHSIEPARYRDRLSLLQAHRRICDYFAFAAGDSAHLDGLSFALVGRKRMFGVRAWYSMNGNAVTSCCYISLCF
jgi:hypothetical protein